ncbi:MAG: sel1 repeat family protein [Deltaproteobacteria bacterium]|nr:sel1 repeat family protein [Deltaproteobacteria bacterium]
MKLFYGLAGLMAALALSLSAAAVEAQTPPAPPAPPAPAETAESTAPAANDQQAALDALVKDAEAGKPEAMLTMGSLWERGLYVPSRNYGKAAEWYQKAADAGLAEGLYNLGVCYEIGMGVVPNIPKALELYQRAAEKKLGVADYKLGKLYLNGMDLERDLTKGLDYLNQAANGGFTLAIKELALISYMGLYDQPRDLTKAMNIFTRAAEAGDPEAMKNVGAMIAAGEGLKADQIQALKWFLLAQRFGPELNLQPVIDDLKGKLKPPQIAEAESLAKDWANKRKDEPWVKASDEAAARQAQVAAAEPAQK